MKCLVLTSEYPPSTGGVAIAAATFSREMAARGWSLTIVAPRIPGHADLERSVEGTIHRLVLYGGANIWYPLAGDTAGFDSLLAAIKPDVTVIHGWQGWCILVVPRLHALGVPVILQSHGFGMHRIDWSARPPFGLKKWFGYLPFILQLPAFIRKLHTLSVLSTEPSFLLAFDHWLAHVLGASNVVTIPNGVPPVTGAREDFLKYCPPAAGKRIVLNVANYCDRKNQLLALEVLRREAFKDVMLVLIGSEPNAYSEMLVRQAADWGITHRVAILTGVERHITEAAIASCDVALMTSTWEMQPLFLLEAMSAAKPWISTEVGSVNELRGGLVTSRNPDEIAAALDRLLARDTEVTRLSSEGNAQWHEEFSPEIVYDRWNRLLAETCNPPIH